MAYGITYVSPVDVTPTWVTEDQWFTTDVSAYVPAGAIAAVLEVGCPAVESYVGWRKPGSTDTHIMSQEDRSHVFAIVGLDSNRQFELWLDNDNFEVFIVGYIPAGAGEIETNWIDKSTATTVTWVEIDLSSNITGGVGAAAIMRIKNTDGAATYDIGVRSTDSTDEEFYRSWRAQTATSLLTGLDSTEKCEQKIENVPMDIWYCGAIYSGYISMQNTPTDYSTTTRGSWVDTALSAMAAGSKMAIILGHAIAAERRLKIRKDGDTWDFTSAVYGDMIYALYMAVGTDAAKEIEQWCEDLTPYPELFLIGEALDGGGAQRQFNSTIAAASNAAAIDLAVKRPLSSTVAAASDASAIDMAVQRAFSSVIAAASTTSGIDLDKLLSLVSTIAATSDAAVIDLAVKRALASAIVAASNTASVDLAIKRPLASVIAAASATSGIDLSLVNIVQFLSTIAAASATSSVDLAIKRALQSAIAAASDAAAVDMLVKRPLTSAIAAASATSGIDLSVTGLVQFLSTIAAGSTTSAVDLAVQRRLVSSIAAAATTSGIDLDKLLRFASALAVTSLTADIDLSVKRALTTGIVAAADAANIDLVVLRQFISSLAATSSVSSIDLLLLILGEIINPSIDSTSVSRTMDSQTTGRTFDSQSIIRTIESAPE